MLSRKGFISTQPARICPQLRGDEMLQLCMGLLSARGTGKVADPIPAGCACPGDTSLTLWPRLPPTPLLQRSVWSQPSPPRYLTAFGADLLSAGPGWLRPQRGPPHAGMGGLRWLPPGCKHLLLGEKMVMDTAAGSIVHPSIRSGSVRVVAGSWCLAAVRSGAQPVALEPGGGFSVLHPGC